MKRVIFLYFLLGGMCSFGQVPQVESPTKVKPIFAVGNAELDKENLVFKDPLIVIPLNDQQKKMWSTFEAKVKNDFKFYSKIFSSFEGGPLTPGNFNKPDFRSIKGTKRSFFILFKIQAILKSDLTIVSHVYDSKSEKLFLERESRVSGEQEAISFAHEFADTLYQRITGKRSIFNSKIVFVSDINSKGKKVVKELYIMDFDGNNVKQLSHHGGIVISPAFSNDGKKIIYSLLDYNKIIATNTLYLLDLGSGKSRLVSNKSGLNTGAVFLPNDKEIALTLSYKGNAEIYRMDLSSKKISQLTKNRANDVDPAFSFNGNKMAFLSDRSGTAHVYTMSASGVERDVKRISFVGKINATPRFSPDGSELVFSSWVDKGFDLFRISSDSNKLVRLTQNFGSNEDPSYSPDGQHIVFSSQRVLSSYSATQNLYIMDRDGEILGSLTKKMGNCISPRWSK